MKILVIDVGGTNLKVGLTGRKEPLKIPSGPEMSASKMVAAVKKATAGWKYDAVSIGYPGPVVNKRPAQETKTYEPFVDTLWAAYRTFVPEQESAGNPRMWVWTDGGKMVENK